jgi:putative addiction module killer protein
MIEIRKTDVFAKWLDSLKDVRAKARILVRIDRMQNGNFGDVSSVGEGISELRIFYGPGYRIYFVQRGSEIVILLNGGDKSSQSKDIAKAKKLAQELED